MILVARALAAPFCGTPEQLAMDPATRLAPDRLGHGVVLAASGKSNYGTPYDNHVDSTNFSVNDPSGETDPAILEQTAAALEVAWTAFLVDADWRPPVSSDTFKLWVLLDDGLGGTTGYTTEYVTDEYPEGYPAIYLNPTYAWDAAFWEALVAHEFMHAIQYAYRDYDYTDPDETWYWEASAMWADELALPENDTYAVQGRWYTTRPDLRYSSTDDSHPYGMFLLNAWAEELGGDDAAMFHAWAASEARRGDAWSDILADTLGTDVETIWAGFTRAVGGRGLRESSLYPRVETVGTLEDGTSGSLPLLGTDYYVVGASGVVRVTEGEVFLSASAGEGDSVPVDAGEVVAVTARSEGAAYVLGLSGPGDTGDDSGDGGDPPKDTDGVAGGEEDPDAGVCGCAAAPGPGWFAWLGAWAIAARTRRREAGRVAEA